MNEELLKKRAGIFFWAGVVPALFFQLIGAYLYFIAYADSTVSQIIYIVVKVLLVAWPLLWYRYYRLERFAYSRKQTSQSAKAGFGTGVFFIVVILVAWLVVPDIFQVFKDQMDSLRVVDVVMKYYVPFALFISVVHSLLEEFYWRWFVLRGLSLRYPAVFAAMIGSAFFASHHYFILLPFFGAWISFGFTVAVGLAGFVWCIQYQKTGSFIGSWISHMLVDLVILTIGYFILF